MKKLFRLLFPKYEVIHTSFHTGTNGMKRHREFIEYVNKENIEIINSYITYKENIEIINSYITYHSYSDSHKPEYINYVVKIKK